MSFGGSTSGENSVPKFKSFVSEAELEERRRRRQEEWEKVRKPDQPLEAPEEEYDPRTLYEKLQEQKEKKQAEYEEAHKLKNLIRGLDDDEVAFLELVDKTKLEVESQRLKEESKELQEYRKAVADLTEKETEARLKEFKKAVSILQPGTGAKKSQNSLLAGVVKRKASNDCQVPEKKQRTGDPASSSDSSVSSDKSGSEDSVQSSTPTSTSSRPVLLTPSGLQCIGVLPGLGAYSDSSDSEASSDSEGEKELDFNLLPARQVQVHNDHAKS